MLKELINQNLTIEEKSNILLSKDPHETALELMELEDLKEFVENFNDEAISLMLEYVEPSCGAEIINLLDELKAIELLNDISSDDATDIIDELDNKEEILEKVDEDIKILSSYPEDTTGAIMATEIITCTPNELSGDVFERLVKNADEIDSIDNVFVVRDGILIATVELKALIKERNQEISKIMNTTYQYANSFDLIEDTVKKIRDYDLNSLPVVENERLVGVVNVDDAMNLFVSELEDDFAKFAGLTEEEDIDESTIKSLKKRVPWLITLLLLDLIVSLIISKYESLVEGLPLLVSFQPVILGLAGNCGTQSLAVCIRGIAENELSGKKAFRHMFKELFIGSLLGFIIGLGLFLVVLIFVSVKNENINVLNMCFTVSLSALCSLTFSSFFGALFPLFLNKIKIDPAIASGPFITTINDCIAIVIYFTLASILLF